MPLEGELEVVEPQENEEGQGAQQTAPEPTQDEVDALEMGWKPESEFKGNKGDFVSAKEFVRRKSFYDRISSQSKEIKELRETIGKFSEHHKNLETYTRKQILAELKSAKKEALSQGDEDRLIEVDEAIIQFHQKEKEFEAQEAAEKAKASNPAEAPEFSSWKSRNSWYTKDDELTEFANDIGAVYHNRNPDKTPMEVLAHVEKQVKKVYPDKFVNKNREKDTSVESGTAAASASKAKEKYNLSEDERRTGTKWVKMGLYKSIDEYAEELKKLNGE